ncbi:MAG: XcyI family restriction endonuclease [Chloroflexota bacterium]
MPRNFVRDPRGNYTAWSIDQLAKSEFFHQKLHEWGIIEITEHIENVRGEDLDWNFEHLGITELAWNKVIHRGIKPIIIFAHPQILQTIPRAVSYYRMLAMVSQKSMNNIGIPVTRFEERNDAFPDNERASGIALHLNRIISALIETDNEINPREFDLWRGMAAGAQADGSWRNLKGQKAEIAIKGAILRRLKERDLIQSESDTEFLLKDKRRMVFADEPDVALYKAGKIVVALEIKGGIDTSGVLERIGTAIKSLIRAREENPEAITLLLLQAVSMTPKAADDLAINQNAVNYWFTIEEFLESSNEREKVFQLMGI